MRILAGFVCVMIVGFGLAAILPVDGTEAEEGFSTFVDQTGRITLPKDYKAKWVHLGDWAVAKKKGESVHELHEVYAQPGVVAAFNRTGEFPDGATIVKEVRKTTSGEMTTGHVAWPTEIAIWFVMIKDKKGRFPGSPHWGDGWGWALYKADDPTKNVSVNYKTSCLGCHVPAKEDDWIYLRGYPELKKPDAKKEESK